MWDLGGGSRWTEVDRLIVLKNIAKINVRTNSDEIEGTYLCGFTAK